MSELGPMFAHLFQQSIDTGEIPKEWSLANICPLYKKEDRSLACNCRPVSLTCVPCKLNPGRFGPIPVRSGRFGPGRFGPISGVSRFGPVRTGRFGPIS